MGHTGGGGHIGWAGCAGRSSVGGWSHGRRGGGVSGGRVMVSGAGQGVSGGRVMGAMAGGGGDKVGGLSFLFGYSWALFASILLLLLTNGTGKTCHIFLIHSWREAVSEGPGKGKRKLGYSRGRIKEEYG